MQTPHRKAPDQEIQTFLLVTELAAQREMVYAGKSSESRDQIRIWGIRGQLNQADFETQTNFYWPHHRG